MPDFEIHVAPEDPLLFGDNRSARAGEDHALRDQDPSPAVLYGAIGARIAARLGAHGESDWNAAEPVLGPFVADLETAPGTASGERAALLGFALRDGGGRPWFPCPLHLAISRTAGRLFAAGVLRPAGSDGGLSFLPAGLERLAFDGTPGDDLEGGWIELDLLGRVLAGTPPAPGTSLSLEFRTEERFFRREPRLGLAMTNHTNTATEARLFSRPYRRFATELSSNGTSQTAGFVAWLRTVGAGDPTDWDGVGFLGGDRRRVTLSFRDLAGERPLTDLLAPVLDASEASAGWFAYLLTPAIAEPGRPLGIAPWHGREPVAAALGRTTAVSGWSGAARRSAPRPIRTLIPAGSVYFFRWSEGETGEVRRTLLAERWFDSISPRGAAAGFGRALVGVWT